MILEELKHEEAKYRKLYDEKSSKNWVLDGLKADAFKLAIQKLESLGLVETYRFFKNRRDEYSQSSNPLGRNLANAYNLVIGKLWKYYAKEVKESLEMNY